MPSLTLTQTHFPSFLQGVWPLLIESALILLQTVPTHISVDKLKMRLLEKTEGVLAVHEFHVWQVRHHI